MTIEQRAKQFKVGLITKEEFTRHADFELMATDSSSRANYILDLLDNI